MGSAGSLASANLLPHEDLIASAVSDDRRFAATVSQDGSAKRWKIAEGTSEQWSLTEAPGSLEKASVSISPEGNYVVVCTGDSTAPGRALIRRRRRREDDPPGLVTSGSRWPRFCTSAPRTPPRHGGQVRGRDLGNPALERGDVGTPALGTVEAPGAVRHIAVSRNWKPPRRSWGRTRRTGEGSAGSGT